LTEIPGQHIEPAEMSKLLEGARRGGGPSEDAANLHPHLAVCSSCRDQFEKMALDSHLNSLRRTQFVSPHSDCPPPAIWREIVGGPTQPDQTLAHLEHASRCDQCGLLLREAVAEFAELNRELTEDERKRIASLESANEQWQHRLARQIAETQHPTPNRESSPRWRKWLSVPQMAFVGVSALALVAVASWVVLRPPQFLQTFVHRDQRSHAADLLARAYTEKRSFELRIPGAAYAPVRVSRGPVGSFANRPKDLLNAEALIATQLESQPASASWLQDQAEADLLEGRYDAAVEALRRASELEPHSPPVLTDLATAYFQRGAQKDRPDDFGAAYEYLSQALKFLPDDPVALFNRAIVSERQFLYQQALDDWDHYLRVDPSSPWAEEARNRADALRQKLRDHKSKLTPLLSPSQFAALASGASRPPEVDQRIEEYLDEAIRSWLPEAFPECSTGQSTETPAEVFAEADENRGCPKLAVAPFATGNVGFQAAEAKLTANPQTLQALFFLAELTTGRHNDRWLSDLLRGASAPHFAQAVNALARADGAFDASDYDVSHAQAELAERLFRASGNTAGVLRARFHEAHAEQLARRSEECRRNATTALAESERYPYSWLQIQFGLEKGICSGLMGDLGAYQTSVQRALERAQENEYGALHLRATGSAVDYALSTGDQPGFSRLANAGLKNFWAAPYPAMRGYSLYTELATGAAGAGRAYLQLATWRQAVSLIDSDRNLLFRALAHKSTAEAAAAARQPQVAEVHFAEAARLLAAAPRTEASRNDALEIEVRTAQLESSLGRSDNAIARLTGVEDQIRSLSNNYLAQMFYSTLGQLQLSRHQEAEAEQALRAALALAEQNLATLKSDADRAAWSKNAAPAYLALVEAEFVEGRAQEALETYEWYLAAYQCVPTNPRLHPSAKRTPDPPRLSPRLPLLTNQTVLAYAALPHGLAIWVYDDREVTSQWTPEPTDGLQELAERFNRLCSDPNSELIVVRRDSRALYQRLIAPVEQRLAPGRTLVIEAEGWLAQVPFEALLDAKGRYLVERTPIVHSLGGESQARLRGDTAISPDLSALVVGSVATSSADGLIPLPDIAAETDIVASGFHSARVLKAREATLSAIQSELPRARVFHFTGHALAVRGRTGLLLEAPETNDLPLLMDASIVRKIRLQGLRLAVLSACSTASGSGGSSGFESVTDAFLRAGVPHVVASRWAVDSTETQAFVRDFYRNALSGETVPDAIRLAASNMLARRDTSHPYYWTAFAAYGQP